MARKATPARPTAGAKPAAAANNSSSSGASASSRGSGSSSRAAPSGGVPKSVNPDPFTLNASMHVSNENQPLKTLSEAQARLDKRRKERNVAEFTMAEVSEHSGREDCWVIVDGEVYDVTTWVDRHPGGLKIILGMAGRDVSAPFGGYHPPATRKWLATFRIGRCSDYHRSEAMAKFFELHDRMRDMGWYKPQWDVYFMKAALHAAVLGLVWLAAANSAQAPWISALGAGVVMGMWWQQLSFIGHDAGHNSASQDRKTDCRMGLLVTLMYGVSGQWWRRTHFIHHTNTNSVDYDPDIQHLPFLAVSNKIFDGFFSKYHQKQFSFGAVERFLVQFQHVLYVPIMAVARINLYLQSLLLLLNPWMKVHYRFQELASIALFWWWYTALVAQFPTVATRAAFVALSHMVCGIIHVQITLSHFAMDFFWGPSYPTKDKTPKELAERWAELQMATSLDVDCPTWMDWFHGGLQYQTIHHLFPLLPRHRLRKARDMLVKELFEPFGLEYNILSFSDAIGYVLAGMKAEALRSRVSGQLAVHGNMLGKLINAEG